MTEKEKDEAFEYVLDKVSRNALVKLQMDPDDERYVSLVGFILVHFSETNTDEYLIQLAQRYLAHEDIRMAEEEVREIVLKTREKCDRQQFALETAFDQIENDHLSGKEVYKNLRPFLSRSV